MSSRILVVAEHDGSKLNVSTAKAVTCATKLPGATVDVVVLAADASALAAQAAAIAGVAKVVVVENPANQEPLAAVYAPQVAKLAAGYTHVFGPSTTFGKDVMPRVAALLGVSQVSDIMAVEGSHRFQRPIYAGNAIITVEAPQGSVLVGTVRTASYAAAANGGSAATEALALDVALPTHTRFVELAQGKSDRPDLQGASRVVSGGRALA